MSLRMLVLSVLLAGALGSYHPQPHYEPPARYNFAYAVKDDYSGNDFGHQESRDGYKTTGEYKVLLPDGRTQVVTYTADETGYHPVVTYVGEATYPAYKPAPYKPAPYKPAPYKPAPHKPAPYKPAPAPYHPEPYKPAPYHPEPAPYKPAPPPYHPDPYHPEPYKLVPYHSGGPYHPEPYKPAPYRPSPYKPAPYKPLYVE